MPPAPSDPAGAPPEAPRRGFIAWLKGIAARWAASFRAAVGGGKASWSAPYVTLADGRRRKPRILFVCTGNANRSVMAECFAEANGFHAESAGTFPAPVIPPEVVEAMREKGHDLSTRKPQLLDVRRLDAFDRVILFDALLPEMYRRHPNVEPWRAMDPAGFPTDGYRMVRDDLERQVRRLARNWQHKVKPPPQAAEAASTHPPG